MKIFTIGFTKKSAQSFFGLLRTADVRQLIDVRLNNVSQLAGFAKRDDLRFFTQELCHIGYSHCSELAPTQPMLDSYKKQKGIWKDYEDRFIELMRQRRIEETLSKDLIASGCLLCSEDKPHHCHRRLVAEYLREKWGGVEIVHLV